MPKSRQKKIKAVDPFCPENRKKFLLQKKKELDRAPKHGGSQPIPRSLKNMMEATKQLEEKQTPTVQKIGSVERIPGESHNQFMKRVGRSAKKKLKATRESLETDEMKGTGRIQSEAALQKKKERLAELQQRRKGKKFEKRLENQEKDFYQDHVKFGEVVSAPPVFSAKPRKSDAKTDKPGSRQLLLSSMLHKESSRDDRPITRQPGRANQPAKVKRRKDMTNAEKRTFDRSRDAAILAYRKAKGLVS